MRDLGILLTDALALKAHQGTKTVTRRPMAVQPPQWGENRAFTKGQVVGGREVSSLKGVFPTTLAGPGWDAVYWLDNPRFLCRAATIRGAGTAEVGGRVWVRECWAPVQDPPANGPAYLYRASADHALIIRMAEAGDRWRPSIHMKKAASRTWGHIVSVRPCDLSGIDHAEAAREGFDSVPECLDAIRGLYPDTRWFWRVEWATKDATVGPKQTDPLTQWARVGSTWERTNRRPLLDATVYPTAAGAHWRIHRVDAGPRDYIRTGDAPSIEEAKKAATAALLAIAGGAA